MSLRGRRCQEGVEIVVRRFGGEEGIVEQGLIVKGKQLIRSRERLLQSGLKGHSCVRVDVIVTRRWCRDH